MQKKNFLILRNYTVEPIFNEIKHRFKDKNYSVNFKFSSYDSAYPDLLKIQDKKLKKYDGIIIFFSFESFFKGNNKQNLKDVVNNFTETIQNIIFFLQNKGIKNIYFFYFTSNTIIKKYYKKSILKKVKNNFSKLSSTNIKIFNLSDEIFLYDKKKNWIDKKYWNYSMFPFNGFGLRLISNIVFFKIKEIFKFNLKTIIVDADNTLWNGIIDEVGIKKINFLNKKSNINYLTFQNKLKKLSKNGLLLCLCTKNDPKIIKKTFKFHEKKMPLKFKDFVIVKANWKPKVANIKEIHRELNLSLENSLFIDDSIFEIDSCNSLIPKLDTINFFEYKNLYSNIDKILVTNNFKNTIEDKKRVNLYKQEFKRNKIKLNFTDIKSYIKSLKIIIEIKLNAKQNISRLSQLTLRTNQFNSNAIRLNENDIKNKIYSKDHIIYQCEAADKFGDYGIIGMALVELKHNQSVIKSFIMSCRALGREIEEYFFDFIKQDLKKKNHKKISIEYKKSEKNKLMKEFLDKNCKKVNQTDRITYYSIDPEKRKKNKNIIKVING